MPAVIENQMGGNATTVELDAIPDIAAEQAAVANAEAAATQKIEEVAQTQQQPKVDDRTPAQKQADEVTKAEEKAETLSIDDFLAQKKPTTVEAKPTTKVVEPAKPATPEVKPVERDFTGIAPEHQPLFKQMSNEAFNTLKAEYLENRQLKQELAEAKKGGLPPSYYEHEQAYVLTPEFSQHSENVSQAEVVLGHYTQQLQALRSGADSYTVLQRDAQGRLVSSAPIKADRTTIDQIADVRQNAYQQLLNAQAQLNAVGAVHRQRANEYRQQLDEFDAKAFPIFRQKPELKAMVDDTIKQVLPPAYRNNPLAKLLAQSILIITEQGKALAAKLAAAATQQQTQQTQQRQPSAAEIASGGAASTQGQTEEVTFDMFQRAKKGLL